MNTTVEIGPSERFAFASSVAGDVWHPKKDPRSYEWWYFDALSDDGSEAVVVVFLDNFIFSPRYNSRKAASERRFPAVSFTYFKNGKAIYRCINEYPADAFSSEVGLPNCRIGDCEFTYETAEYGTGYVVNINTKLSGERRLEARFEWLSIESDFSADEFCLKDESHCWNLVAPRSDVTGHIAVFNRKGAEIDARSFRGTGYHDHNLDDRWLAKTVRDWHWGRAHFSDSTAVFYRYCEIGDDNPNTKLMIIKNGELTQRNVSYDEQNYVRDKYGIRYPTRLRLISEDNVRLGVKPTRIIDASFYYLRFLSEITLTLSDGTPRKTTGITEFIAPKSLKYRWLNWISDIRTGKNGKGPLI